MRIQPIVWKKRLLLFNKKTLKLELAKIDREIARNHEWLAQKASLQRTRVDEKFYTAQLLCLWKQKLDKNHNLQALNKQTEKLDNLEEKVLKAQYKAKELTQEAEALEFKATGFAQNFSNAYDKTDTKESHLNSAKFSSEPKHVALLEFGKERVIVEYVKSSTGEGLLSFDFNHNNHQSLNEFRKQILKRLKENKCLTGLYINGSNS
jgi:hypothetical protein